MSLSPSAWLINKKHIRANFISGFIVFLIALPLSIGVSIASGAPASAGLIAATVGGIIGSAISGSYVTISGPAAGLIVVILESIHTLGNGNNLLGFRLTLAAIVFAGLIQVLLGMVKAGTLALLVPRSVVQGMLSSIGFIIVTKQIYILVGAPVDSTSVLVQFFKIPTTALLNFNTAALIVGTFCFILLLVFRKLPKVNKFLPGPLAAISVGVIISQILNGYPDWFLHSFNLSIKLEPQSFLTVPSTIDGFFNHPLFENLLSYNFLFSVLAITLVASIESVISTSAVDDLDPIHRKSDLNKDLISKGFCNMILGLIGGIPVISEIVRSSVNIENGATSRLSNFFHGFFILIFVLLGSDFLNQIPLSAFAAILIYVGIKLINFEQIKKTFNGNYRSIVIFCATSITILATDLLIGIICGSVLGFILNHFNNKKVEAI